MEWEARGEREEGKWMRGRREGRGKGREKKTIIILGFVISFQAETREDEERGDLSFTPFFEFLFHFVVELERDASHCYLEGFIYIYLLHPICSLYTNTFAHKGVDTCCFVQVVCCNVLFPSISVCCSASNNIK